jgi:5'-3' exonuclease
LKKKKMTNDKKRALIIDGNNLYIRNYVMNPAVSTKGDPIGGTYGTIKSLQKLCREIRPDRIIIAWDGKGGSSKKRILNKNYKDGRKPLRLNRNIQILNENQELENKIWQMTRTVEYINYMPVIQLLLDSVEADDVISAVAQHPDLKEYNKIIVSNDRDFIQICGNSTILYRPVKDEALTVNKIIEEFGIHPNNFCIARAIAGDTSDNLKGVPGAGLATVAKRLPFLKEQKAYTLDDILEYCSNVDSKIKFYTSIAENEVLVRENYTIMQLAIPNMSIQDKQKIDYAMRNSECNLNKTEIIKMMLHDGFGETNFEELYAHMNKIVAENC